MYHQETTLEKCSAVELLLNLREFIQDGWVPGDIQFRGSPENPKEWTVKLTKTEALAGRTLSPWIVIEGFCATRVIAGTDPAVVGNRVAFIEKTPRVCINGTWINGPKGAGGSDGQDPSKELYGFYPPSREWADKLLRSVGAII
jgi:hypothetical protein